MDESEHRALWGSFGIALLIAGVVVLSEWTFVVVAAVPIEGRDLALLWWPWAGAGVFMIEGVYVMSAASIPNWWLPGKKALSMRQRQYRVALSALGQFHFVGRLLAQNPNTRFDAVWVFQRMAQQLVVRAFGLPFSQRLMVPLSTTSTGAKTPAEVLTELNASLVILIELSPSVTVSRDFGWGREAGGNVPVWLSYLSDLRLPLSADGHEQMAPWHPPE